MTTTAVTVGSLFCTDDTDRSYCLDEMRDPDDVMTELRRHGISGGRNSYPVVVILSDEDDDKPGEHVANVGVIQDNDTETQLVRAIAALQTVLDGYRMTGSRRI